jgi:hypothetical protein
LITPAKLIQAVDFTYRRWLDSILQGPRLKRFERAVQELEPRDKSGIAPIVMFNASARTWGLSQNAAFSLLTSWGLRISGVPVVQYVCDSGMEQCVLGTVRTRLYRPPPCGECTRLSRQLYSEHRVKTLEPSRESNTRAGAIDQAKTLANLRQVVIDDLALGEICFPSLRWAMRRHNIPDSPQVRDLYRKYLRSALHIARSFKRLLEDVRPSAVVVFNGVMFPEAITKHVSQREGIRVVTHEVGVRPFSCFFTHGEATAYPVEMDVDFTLSPEDDAVLDEYLSQRFKGDFSMAGVRFWPDMQGLDDSILEKMDNYSQTVAVFANVIFDTSQVHANTVFKDMFDWLAEVVAFARQRPETLFVIRAHPDELRPGKESQETTEAVLLRIGAFDLANVVFVRPLEYMSSYELIRLAKLILVYNSSIGLESTLLRRVVLCAGKSRFTDYPTVYFPNTRDEYFNMADDFLRQDAPRPPEEFIRQARRFTYFQHYFTSLDFSTFLTPHPKYPGYVHLRDFDPIELHIDRNDEIRIIHDGILEGAQIVYGEAHQ